MQRLGNKENTEKHHLLLHKMRKAGFPLRTWPVWAVSATMYHEGEAMAMWMVMLYIVYDEAACSAGIENARKWAASPAKLVKEIHELAVSLRALARDDALERMAAYLPDDDIERAFQRAVEYWKLR